MVSQLRNDMPRPQLEWLEHALCGILGTQRFSHGSYTRKFEERFAAMNGRKYGVATSSGTTALMLASLVFERRPVTIPELTVPMVRWATETMGNPTEMTDVSITDFCAEISPLVSNAVVVLTAGIVSPRVVEAVQRMTTNGHSVVVDASHAHGATFPAPDGPHPVGRLGTVAVFSFYATKIFHCGEGGIILTDDESLYREMRRYSNGGKDWGTSQVVAPTGLSLRISEMAAAVGLSFLLYADEVLAARRERAALYDRAGLAAVQSDHAYGPSWYRFTVRVPPNSASLAESKLQSIGGVVAGRTHGSLDGRFYLPNSQRLSEAHINLPTAGLSLAETWENAQLATDVLSALATDWANLSG